MPRGGPSSESIRIHQLLTPLGHIMGFADLLLEEIDKSSKEEIRSDVEKIRKAAGQMLGIIQEERAPQEKQAPPTSPFVKSTYSDEDKAEGSVLVVDDDANNRILIARNLKKRGFDVSEAQDGFEALELIRTSPFDLILCDIVMPGMDGIELLQHVQAEFGDQILVMMISALDQMEMVEQCLDMEAVDFISKPFEPYILLAKVRANIRRKRRREKAQP